MERLAFGIATVVVGVVTVVAVAFPETVDVLLGGEEAETADLLSAEGFGGDIVALPAVEADTSVISEYALAPEGDSKVVPPSTLYVPPPTTPSTAASAASPTTIPVATTVAKLATTTTTVAKATKPKMTQPTNTTTVAKATTTTTVRSTTTSTVRKPPPEIPSDAVYIAPGKSIQAAVDKHPAGTTFVIERGVHKRQTVVPKAKDVFVGESGAVMDGGGVIEYAFRGNGGDDVVIRGLEIRNYATPLNTGTVRGGNAAYDWLVEGNDIHHNEGAGVAASSGWIVRNNHIHHNQQYGLTGSGGNILIEGNEIDNNNPNREVSPSWGAGGSKWIHTKGLVVRDNYSHDNQGPGLWTDGHNIDTLYEGNRVVDNLHAGIKHEISCDAVIRDNLAEGNGFGADAWVDGAGILVLNSPNVEVYGNTVRNNNDGIGGIYAHRNAKPDLCPLELRNFNVHHNTIIMEVGQNGIATNVSSGVLTTWNNRFDYNTYALGSQSKYYRWGSAMTTKEWRNGGHDTHGNWN